MLAAAASIAIAFGLGMAADRTWTAPRRPVAEVASAAGGAANVDTRPASGRAQQETERPNRASGAGVARDAGAERAPPGDSPNDRSESIPAYVRSQLERRGYQVDSRRQFVSVSLPGGRKATLPVERWNLSYVGNRVY
jgi:hypothetical protein